MERQFLDKLKNNPTSKYLLRLVCRGNLDVAMDDDEEGSTQIRRELDNVVLNIATQLIHTAQQVDQWGPIKTNTDVYVSGLYEHILKYAHPDLPEKDSLDTFYGLVRSKLKHEMSDFMPESQTHILNTISSLNLIPSSVDELDLCVRRYLSNSAYRTLLQRSAKSKEDALAAWNDSGGGSNNV